MTKVTKIAGLNLLSDDHEPAVAPAWLAARRQAARTVFATSGLPHVRDENWRYTNLRTVAETEWQHQPANENAPRLTALPDVLSEAQSTAAAGPSIVLYQGHIQPHLSKLSDLPDGVRLIGLADLLRSEPDLLADYLATSADDPLLPLAALNAAHTADGAVLLVDDDVDAGPPISIVSIGAPLPDATPCVFHPRLLVVAGRGSRVSLLEQHVAAHDGDYFTNVVSEIFVGEGASVDHTKIQNDAETATHLAAVHLNLAARASYNGFVLQVGAAIGRHEVGATLGRGVHLKIGGAYLGAGTQHLDTTLRVDHQEPEAVSRQHIKGVLTDKAEGVFQGKVIVRPGAQQTDGQQLSRALLLSDEARVRSKPELEIYADDVQCGHGATAGALSEDALFYLTARGIDSDTARAMLIGAFVDEVLGEIADPAAMALCRSLVGDWLHDQTGHAWNVIDPMETAA